MEKVIRNGKVAVLVSRGFRTGWYTHHGIQELLFHPKVVEMVEECKKQDICKFVDEALNVEVSRDGAMGIVIHWLPVGEPFMIIQINDYEYVYTSENLNLVA